jgi:putative ABC transport system permease protein
MTVMVRPRPPDPRSDRTDKRDGDGGGPARRAIVRWAWRLFRRQWRQQLLVLALLTLAVGATTMGLAVASNTVSRVDSVMGTANHRFTLPASDPNLAADIASIQKWFGTSEVIAHRKVAIPGSVASVDLRDQSSKGVYSSPTVRLVAGRYPAGVDEVAVTDAVASTFDLHIGDTWKQGGADRGVVVGLVENPQNLLDKFALVPPGQVNRPDEVSILVDATAAKFRAFRPEGVELNVDIRSSAGQAAAAIAVLALGTIGMLFVGLVAVAGFTVMAQRRLRAIGMLGAIGATYRHVRLVMVANGAVVGTIAAVAGSIIGLLGWLAFAPLLERFAGHRVSLLALPWWAIALAMALALVTAIGAAWWPARAASRMPIVVALSGRPPRPQPAKHFAVLGSALVVSGLLILVFVDKNKPSPLPLVSGIVATSVGVLLLAPLGIAGLAVLAGRSPLALRLALRDLARYQARSGAALAAVTLAIGIAITIAVSASAAQAATTPSVGNLPDNQLVVHLGGGRFGAPLPEQSPSQLQELQVRVDELATTLHARDVLALEAAVNPSGPDVPRMGNNPGGKPPAGLVKVATVSGGFSQELVAPLYVATPAVLEHSGINPNHVDPTADVVTSRTDLRNLEIGFGARQTVHPKIQTLNLPKYSSGTGVLITTQAMQKFGLQPVAAGWLIQTPEMLNAEQISAAQNAAAAAGLTIETRSAQTSLAQLRDWSTGIGMVVALGVLSMTVGLIRAETADDLRILTATGANGTIRRNLTSCTAGALALLGAVLGTVGAYAALVAWHRSDLGKLRHPPVTDLAIIVVGLPLAAVIAGWILAGREPPAIARKPLE